MNSCRRSILSTSPKRNCSQSCFDVLNTLDSNITKLTPLHVIDKTKEKRNELNHKRLMPGNFIPKSVKPEQNP